MPNILPGIVVPDDELTFNTARGGGPGGQNVNRVESRVTLVFDIAGSAALSEEHRRRIVERLGSRLTRRGVLRVTPQRHRSQAANPRPPSSASPS